MPSRTTHKLPATAGKTDWTALDALSDAEIEAAAEADPDAPPLAEDKSMHRMAPVKRLRLSLRLGREAFAERYRIPVETLRAWENHESEPDAVALAYLDAILGDPEGTAHALRMAAV